MAVFCLRRGAPKGPLMVTITGTGNATYCYATINGVKYSSATSDIEVESGDVVTFGIVGSSLGNGSITINGVEELTTSSSTVKTFEWSVPNGATEISIEFEYINLILAKQSIITVTIS